MAFRQEIAAQAVGDLARIDPIILLFAAAIARNISGCATFTCSACGST
jgi:hypothetical protein